MFVEGTLRWQVTEDCPWDLLMALALRDLGDITDATDPLLPKVIPAPAYVSRSASASGSTLVRRSPPTKPDVLREQWRAWWSRTLVRETRPAGTQLKPPHFSLFDRELELQDLVADHFADATAWTEERHDEYMRLSAAKHDQRVADIVEVVHQREHELRRQAAYFRLDINILPFARPGAWIVAPHTVVVSSSFRHDSRAFREWFIPLVAAIV
jgi:hypothetical protein